MWVDHCDTAEAFGTTIATLMTVSLVVNNHDTLIRNKHLGATIPVSGTEKIIAGFIKTLHDQSKSYMRSFIAVIMTSMRCKGGQS